MASNIPANVAAGPSFWPSISMTEATTALSQRAAILTRSENSKAKQQQGLGIVSFLTAISVAVAIFSAQFLLFASLRNKLARIFKPKTYLVPERERTEPPPANLVSMIGALVTYDEREVIKKCGLDAYFFLRYLKTLLVIFVPISFVVLPILLPLNFVDGIGRQIDISDGDRNSTNATIPTGLDTLAWGNVAPNNRSRYTAHLIMAILVVIWVCTVFFFELRVYIKIRQDYLASAEHRLRASATTVLVSSIPKKWLTEEALSGLFDVLPGGIRNLWINRDLTQLLDKISLRDSIHKQLESAETSLIKAAKKAQLKQRNAEEKRRRRKLNLKALTKTEKAARDAEEDAEANRLARTEECADAGHDQDVPLTDDACILEPRLENRETLRATTSPDTTTGPDGNHNPLHLVGTGLKGVAGKAGRGVNNALGTKNGFVDLSSAQEHTHQRVPSPTPTEPQEALRGSLDDSILTSNSSKATRPPYDPTHHRDMKNSVRKADHADDLYLNAKPKFWQFWKPPQGGFASPVPHGASGSVPTTEGSGWQTFKNSLPFMGPKDEPFKYDDAYECDNQLELDKDAEWAKYIKRRDRPTHHLPLFGLNWMFGMPLITKKVDTIYWCRQELARLNLEIEEDQKHPERFPLMGSAFIQFNHQIAAHMACQCIAHHLPKHMSPRTIEISPRDVVWGNMAISWWQQWLRSIIVVTIVVAMIILWAIPVAWTAAIGQADALIRSNSWLADLEQNKGLGTFVKAVSGVLPAVILAILLVLVPVIFGLLAGFKGAKTGAQKTEFVQMYYFAFLFVQVFLVISIASFFFKSLGDFITGFKELSSVTSVLTLLALNLPSAAIYFFSYMILQALSTSSGTLLQVGSLFMWFIMAPIFDSTARQKWARNTSLNQVNWGSFFPVYTNFACIGLIYCVVAPLISIFAIITFGLLWLAQRYAMLYVNRSDTDTGGVLYPRAINQTFTGIYVMELCLAGLFFIVPGGQCTPHGVIMVAVFILTLLYQVMLNLSFSPLFRYLPITLEDEAVLRDEAFQRAQDVRFGLIQEDEERGRANLAEKATSVPASDKNIELQNVEPGRIDDSNSRFRPAKQVGHWAKAGGKQVGTWARGGGNQLRKLKNMTDNTRAAQYRRNQHKKNLDAQRAIGDALYGGIPDDIEDLTPEERDTLTQHAFLHSALRARRPTVWIPRDDLGVSDDEIRRTNAFSKHIWVSNEGTALDSKVRVVYGKNPPDFSELDIIVL
ncbi:uncharacterized protein MAM_03811 [Metarhizium album ARSEF 1941]|uniref:DUF221 domain-containing protein n=1 Tax=Metarhizium album (strain ARSEF 1941) TaxID=1081103 RepID=A0A0B2WYW4_METAS|nr:uncharacterized protein MAM_03811 [Metarhizium album ARSEF 1941]KHN98050.1 hypothetical protein MAM_03811 [Metarhizium album ARSEF 1941]